MGNRVLREEFSAEKHLSHFQSFNCGDEVWQIGVSNWIKAIDAKDSVLTDIARRGMRVWVYYSDSDELVGFGSLGTTEWCLPGSGRKKIRVSLIPNVAIAREFWGLPPGDTYARQVLDDLRCEAEKTKDTHPALTLCVHPLNHRAIHFYRKYGFAMVEPLLKDGYLRMALML